MSDNAAPTPATGPAGTPPVRRRGMLPLVFGAAAVIGAAAGLGAVYGIGTVDGNGGAGRCAAAIATAAAVTPLVRGEVAALLPAERPLDLSALSFSRGDGTAATVADFAGKTILLNLWATWCVPCREEMPALDRLQGTLGGPGFEVVAVNLDTRDDGRDAAFYRDTGIRHLTPFQDRSLGLFNDLKTRARAVGLPTSLLIDGSGCEIGTMHGPAEWDSPEALALLRAATPSAASGAGGAPAAAPAAAPAPDPAAGPSPAPARP